ncbi:hypothetical protein [Candidatus Magnetominusculus dajiuhuensis]|uniref:hypothetical protein n=1 Tax=Candidatus Magnetominusculus dajiuhuensis TaxID=3137712 RepID=UPI003B42C738
MDAKTLITRAQYQSGKSNYAGAAKILRAALKAALKEEAPNNSLYIECLTSIADTQRMTGNYRTAAENYAKAAAAATEASIEDAALDARLGGALSRRALGHWQDALNDITQIKARYEELGDHAGAAFSTWALAGTLRVKGDINGSIEAFNAAEGIFNALNDTSGTGYCQCGLGGAYRMKGLYDESLQCYTNAGNIFSSNKDRFGTAYSHCGIGNALRMKGSYSDGLRHLNTALNMYGKIGDTVSSAYTLWSIGMLKLMVSDVISGEGFFEAAAARFKKTLDVRGSIYADLGICQARYLHRHLGQYKRPLQRAVKNAGVYSLQLEGCHALKLHSIMETGTAECYKTIGIRELQGNSIPLNIP